MKMTRTASHNDSCNNMRRTFDDDDAKWIRCIYRLSHNTHTRAKSLWRVTMHSYVLLAFPNLEYRKPGKIICALIILSPVYISIYVSA